MEDYGLDFARATLLEDMGRYTDAAELHFAEGNTFEAIRLLTLDHTNEHSLRRALECVLDGLWIHLSCGVAITEESLKPNGTIAKLLRLTDGLQGLGGDAIMRDEVCRPIYSCDPVCPDRREGVNVSRGGQARCR